MVIQGVIRPPPEIRAVADRTALYVAKNGRAFEARILGSEKGKTPKFAFLHQTSPFHAYYEERIQFYEQGGTDDDPKKAKDEKTKDEQTKKSSTNDEKENDGNQESTKTKDAEGKGPEPMGLEKKKKQTQTVSAIDPVAKVVLAQRAKISQIRQAQEDATKKEEKRRKDQQHQHGDDQHRDEDHDGSDQKMPAERKEVIPTSVPFPRPLHYVHIVAPASLTTAQLEKIQLTAQFAAFDGGKNGTFLAQLTVREWNNPEYAFCQPRHGHFAYFSALVDAYRHILDGWRNSTNPNSILTNGNNQHHNRQDYKQRKQEMEEMKHMANNVHKCLEVAAYRAEYDRDREQQLMKERADSGGGGGAGSSAIARIDWHDFVVVETIDFAVDEVVELSMMPPPPIVQQARNGSGAVPSTATSAAKAEADAMDESDSDEDDDEPIRVVPTYTPKVVSGGKGGISDTHVIDPITGKSIPVKDMPEHMRIQLLDPKWAEERKKFQDKQKDSNLVSGDVIASNLERFAQTRGDTTTGSSHKQQQQDFLTKESDPRKRLEEANRIIHQRSAVGPALPGAAPPPPPPPPPPRHNMPYESSSAGGGMAGPGGGGGLQQQQQHDPRKQPPQSSLEPPASKRPRLDNVKTTTIEAPPTTVVQAPPVPNAPEEHPFAAAATGAAVPSMAPMVPTTGGTNASNQDLLSEADFIATLSKPTVTLQVRVPNDRTQMAYNFYGQIVSLSSDVMSTVKAVKQELARAHLNSIPPNKIQLKNVSTGMFMKDNMTLAALNVGPTATIELVPRARGGRK